jgi:hypothetical protein
MTNQQITIKVTGKNYQIIEGLFDNALYTYQNGQGLFPVVISQQPIEDAGFDQDGHQWEAVRIYSLQTEAPVPPVTPVDESAALHIEIATLGKSIADLTGVVSDINVRLIALEPVVVPVAAPVAAPAPVAL